MPEQLEVHIDGTTYTIPRRRLRSGRTGFLLQAGAVVHGRKVWVQVLVADVPPMSDAEKLRRLINNRARRVARKRKAAAARAAAQAAARAMGALK